MIDAFLISLACLAAFLTLGGCHCCSICEFCSDTLGSLSFDVTVADDECNTGCCDGLTNTYVVDLVDDCCVSYIGEPCSCNSDNCEACDATPVGGGVLCCDPDDGTFPTGYCAAYAEGTYGAPGCSGNTEFDDCGLTAGCSADASLGVTDGNCVSNSFCDGVYPGLGGAGYQCERTVACTPTCGCSEVALEFSACIVNDAGTIKFTGSISDGWRNYDFSESLGAGPTVVCLGAINALGLTLSENTNGATYQLCGIPTVTVTGAAA